MSETAIYAGRPYYIVEGDGQGLILEPYDTAERIAVELGEPTLIVDPTDDEWGAALMGYLPTNYTGSNLMDALLTLAEMLNRRNSG